MYVVFLVPATQPNFEPSQKERRTSEELALPLPSKRSAFFTSLLIPISMSVYAPFFFLEHFLAARILKLHITMPTWQELTRQTRTGSHMHDVHPRLSHANNRKI
jgi:hypothetical protein